jgi:hypothetical protein
MMMMMSFIIYALHYAAHAYVFRISLPHVKRGDLCQLTRSDHQLVYAHDIWTCLSLQPASYAVGQMGALGRGTI